ncbi:MAG: type IV secretion system DNA-binding domain-containing protein, partial [Phormidesmis sp.]
VVGNSISQYTIGVQSPSKFVETAIDEHPIASGATLMLMMAAVGALGFVRISMAPQKQKLGTGRFATRAEKKRAKQLANKQNKADGLEMSIQLGEVAIPFANESVLFVGAPGSGKSATIGDPGLMEVIKRGQPAIVFDAKGSRQDSITRRFAPIAAREGYSVGVIAPGKKYSDCLNPHDFIRSPTDASRSLQLANILEKNTAGFNPNKSGKGDFFQRTGIGIVQASIMLSKLLAQSDLMTVSEIINQPDLIGRLKVLMGNDAAPTWTVKQFGQLMASEESEKQLVGMIVTAQSIFERFITADLVPSFCGPSTVPLKMDGKQILFLQVDEETQDAVLPLIAAQIELLIAHNFSEPRKNILALFLDELPLLYLPKIAQYVNLLRSAGLVAFLGVQSLSQLRETYGKEMASSIMSGCRNTLYFNPNNVDTAKEVSARIGECDRLHHTWSRSGALLMKPTRTQHRQKVPLVTPDEINRFGKGKFVMFAPGYQSQDGTQAAIPVLARPKLNQVQIDEQTTAGHIWDKKSKLRLVALRENDPTYISDPDQALAERRAAVDNLLPKAPDEGKDEPQEETETRAEERATEAPAPVDTHASVEEQPDATQDAIAMIAALKK